MFLLVLVAIVAGVGGQGPYAAGSYGYGGAGGLSYGGLYGNGYGSRYNYIPQSQYNNGYGGFSNSYMQGGQNSYIPFYQNSGLTLGSSSSSFRNTVTPQTYDYKQCQKYSDTEFPTFMPQSQSPIIKSTPYYSVPVFESVETYKFYNPSSAYVKNKNDRGLNLDSKVEVVADDKSRNGSLESVESASKEAQKEEPVLQLTYLGYVPHSSYKSASGDEDVAGQRIPFYILDYDESSASPRTSSALPTYVSPTRLLPTSGVYSTGSVAHTQSGNIGASTLSGNIGAGALSGSMGSSSLSGNIRTESVSHGISSQGFSSHIPIRTGSLLSPYGSSYRDAISDDHPGYNLIDVNPVTRVNSRLFSEPLLGVPRPTYNLIQTLTGPMGGRIGGPGGPPSSGLSTNTRPQTQTNAGQLGVNTGMGSYSFGTPGLSR